MLDMLWAITLGRVQYPSTISVGYFRTFEEMFIEHHVSNCPSEL